MERDDTSDDPSPGGDDSNPRTIGGLDLHIIAVDPHRIFAHWYVGPQVLARLPGGAPAASKDEPLMLRVFRVADRKGRPRDMEFLQDVPAAGGWHEGFISLERPGGSVAAALGYADAGGRFVPLVTTLAVTLPEAPPAPPPPARKKAGRAAPAGPVDRSAGRPPAEAAVPPPRAAMLPAPSGPEAPRGEHSADSAADAPAAPPGETILEEEAVLAALARESSLPAELRLPLGREVVDAPESRRAPRGDVAVPLEAPPETPALDERSVVLRALHAGLTDAETVVEEDQAKPDEARPAEVEPPEAAGDPEASESSPAGEPTPSVHQLASQFESNGDGAPVRLEATLVIFGRLQPGHRLRVGNREILPHPGGSFSFDYRLDSFPASWALLLHVLAGSGSEDAPSIELLGRMSDTEALLALYSRVEIEGELRDPEYRRYLPDAVEVDDAGRFRLARPVAAGALFLPSLVLVADAG